MIDLHMHSRYSDDGEYTSVTLVEQCAEKGVRIMSVTDHNCVKANEEAEEAAREKGIRYISGIEIDCTYEDTDFHVLGYGIDFKSGDFEEIEKHVADQDFQASLEKFSKTQALGFDRVTQKDLRALSEGSYWQECWSGEMFAEVLLAMPEYAEHPLLKPYRPGGERSDNPYVNFYWDYYAQGKPCYVRINYPSMEEIIDVIHRNHGAAVLAHPGVNLKGKEHLLEGILGFGIDGIEAFSSYHSPEQAEAYYKIAREKKLLVTCGSDYHGKTKPSIGIGQHGCRIPYTELEMQLKRIYMRRSVDILYKKE